MLDTVLRPPSLEFDPYAEEVILHPQAFLEAVRETAGVVYLPAIGAYAVGRLEEALQVSKDHGAFTSSRGMGVLDITRPGSLRPSNAMLESDPPYHTHLRKVMQKIISPSRVRSLQDMLLERARLLVDRLLEQPAVDGTHDVAQGYILDVFPRIIGVELPFEPAIAVSTMMLNLIGPVNAVSQRAIAAAERHLAWFETATSRSSAAAGGLAALTYEAEEQGLLPAGIGHNMAITFVAAGFDSTVAGIANILNLFAQNPSQWQVLRANPGLVANAIGEGIRYDPPFRAYYRVTTSHVTLGGFALEPETKIGVWMGAVGRDGRHFARPDVFDIARKGATAALGFGTGIHNCLGQVLAKAETAAILTALLERVAVLEPAGAAVYDVHNQVRMPASLPLRLVAG